MDNLKLYAKNDHNLEGLLSTVEWFNGDRGMQFGLDKCANITFKESSLVTSKNITLDIIPEIA